jgi:O-antigen ligase
MFIFYLFLPKIKILKKAIIIFLFFSVPFISLNIIDEYTSKKNLRVDQNRYKTTIEKLFNNKSTITDVKNIINDTSLESNNNSYSVSSGRIEIWKKSTDVIIKEKKILGFGPQGDRYVLTKLAENYLEASWSNNSSNAIIYSIVSGGIIGLILILLIYFSLFLIFLKSIKIIFINKVNDFTLISNFVVFCYLMMRSFFENSFAVFGVDFCIVITVYYIISSRIYYINKAL